MANGIYKTPRVNKRTGDVYTRETTHVSPEGEVVVTSWTDDAWNRAQEANRRYLADLEWQRLHPYLASIRSGLRNAVDWVTNSDDYQALFGDRRVLGAKRAWQNNPEIMLAFTDGLNIASLALTAPFAIGAAIEAAPSLAALSSKGLLAAETAGTLGMTSNQWLPWLLGGTGTAASIPTAQYLSENAPSFSLPNFGGRMLSESADAPSEQSTEQGTPAPATGTTGAAAPAPAPVDPEENPRRRKPRKQKTQAEKDAALDAKYERKGWQPMSQRRRFWSIEHPIRYARQYPWRAAGRTILGVGTAVGPYEMRNTFWPAAGNIAERFFLGPELVPAPRDTTNTTNTSAPADTVPAVTNQLLPDSVITNTNSDWEEWLRTRQTE